MSVDIKKEEIRAKNGRLVAVVPHCVGEKGICRRDNLRFCDCNVLSGNPELPNRFEPR